MYTVICLSEEGQGVADKEGEDEDKGEGVVGELVEKSMS